ncbi:MAG: DUF721 domain-containing protein [Gammaproteobacteria bacterium]
MPQTPSIGHLLSRSGSGVSQVIRRAKELKRLTGRLKSLVDEPLSEHIYVANVRDNTLVIGTDSAVWHTRVKYLAPMLLEQIKQLPELKHIQHITFRVQPFSATSRNKVPSTDKTTESRQAQDNSASPLQDDQSTQSKTTAAKTPTLEQALQGLSEKLKR